MSNLKSIKCKVYSSSYSGCDGWDTRLIATILFKCKDSRLDDAKKRLTKRLTKNVGSYERITVDWSR